MIKPIQLILVCFITTLTLSHADDGLWPKNTSIRSNYEYHLQVSELDIQKHIKESNNKLSQETIISHAKNIIEAASCYQIDSLYLAGLIKKESTFKVKAKSSTGAAGLTQMTGSGLQEIKDQIGLRGSEYARKSNIQYFTSTTKKCLGNEWEQFNETLSLKSKSSIKSKLISNSKFSIYAGAVLLKVYLSSAQDNCPSCTIPQLYSKALEQYNGDTNKVQYAKKIQTYINNWQA